MQRAACTFRSGSCVCGRLVCAVEVDEPRLYKSPSVNRLNLLRRDSKAPADRSVQSVYVLFTGAYENYGIAPLQQVKQLCFRCE